MEGGGFCDACGYGPCDQMERHLRHSPWCRPTVDSEPAAQQSQKRSKTSANLFKSRLRSRYSFHLLNAHYNKYMSLAQLSFCVLMVINIVGLVLSFMESAGVRQSCVQEVREAVRALPSVSSVVAAGERAAIGKLEPLTFKGPGGKKGGVFFSVYQLVTVMLQESAEVRQHVFASSKLWKSGELYGKTPVVYRDVTHGTRFRSRRELCGKATAAEQRDVRVILHGWTDEFTSTDGLGVNAKKNKYGAVLGALVNLPLHLRHNPDFILLLALYQAMYAAANGGLARLLTGVSSDGTSYDDGLTLGAEIRMPGGHEIKLPSDTPCADDETWVLRIYVLLWSMDWLAHGDFGPFAKSVSARRPCFKCKWTHTCDCAYLSLAAQNPKKPKKPFKHCDNCLGCSPRRHEDVLAELKELRSWAGTKTALAARRTELGIFSDYFPSESLLQDIVTDATVDIMHIFICGMTKYMLMFTLDELIPAEFTWSQFNERLRAHKYPHNFKPPWMAARTQGKKSSHTAKLNATQTMYIALARYRWVGSHTSGRHQLRLAPKRAPLLAQYRRHRAGRR